MRLFFFGGGLYFLHTFVRGTVDINTSAVGGVTTYYRERSPLTNCDVTKIEICPPRGWVGGGGGGGQFVKTLFRVYPCQSSCRLLSRLVSRTFCNCMISCLAFRTWRVLFRDFPQTFGRSCPSRVCGILRETRYDRRQYWPTKRKPTHFEASLTHPYPQRRVKGASS